MKTSNVQYKGLKENMMTLLIKKTKVSFRQELQSQYYQTLIALTENTKSLVNDKHNYQKIRINMNSIIYCALVTQDPEMLKQAHLVFGCVCLIFRLYKEAKKQFKYLVRQNQIDLLQKDVCEDMKDFFTKTEAYRLLALCYKHL